MIICTFAGHRDVLVPHGIDNILREMEKLMQLDHDFVFYTGGMGEFDHQCHTAVRRMKTLHPQHSIKLVLVLPYMTKRINTDRAYYETSFDDVILPQSLMGLHYKAAIPARNRWMVDQSDYVLAFVKRNFGGAYRTIQYAESIGKKIIHITA